MTRHGWDEDRAWSVFAPDPEPRHLAERPRVQVTHPVALAVSVLVAALLLGALGGLAWVWVTR